MRDLPTPPDAATAMVVAADTVRWNDGDSGEIDGEGFRLADVDAPETGPIGSIGGAVCAAERARGRDAADYMRSLTRQGSVEVAVTGPPDRYGRRVVTIRVPVGDVAALGLAAGHLRRWLHKQGRALSLKPDWCK